VARPAAAVVPFILSIALAGLGAVGLAGAGTSTQLGVYRGGGNPGGVAEFGGWLGRAPTIAIDYFASTSWATIENASWAANAWSESPYRVVYSIPLLPDTGGTLREGAGGAYNVHFRRLAETLVAHGEGDAVLRLGWEFNGDWMRWNARSDPGAYAAYWRQVVQTMRAVSGAQFKFDWCPNLGHFGPTEAAYPGDAYVDYIGMDVYDTWWSEAERTNVVRRWQNMLEMQGGLRWHRAFARGHGKPMTFPEWGLWTRPDGHGGGDNPYYIEKMHEWISQNNVAYHMYFEKDLSDGAHRLMAGRFPQGAAAYRSLFGAAPGTQPPVALASRTPRQPTSSSSEGQRAKTLRSAASSRTLEWRARSSFLSSRFSSPRLFSRAAPGSEGRVPLRTSAELLSRDKASWRRVPG
jgi:hypothetical protein